MTKFDLIQLKTFSYFSILISICSYQTVEAQIISQFSYKIDKNNDGYITHKEFKHIIFTDTFEFTFMFITKSSILNICYKSSI